MGPEPVDDLQRIVINLSNEGLAGQAEFIERSMTIVLSNDFAQPFPKSFNGIEVRTVARQGQEFKAQLLGILAHLLRPMIRCAIPNEDDLALLFVEPSGELVEKPQGGIAIAFAIFPEETSAIGKVIGAKVIQACGKAWRSTRHPHRFAHRRPGKADFHVLVQMHFIEIDDYDFAPAHALIQGLKLFDESGALERVALRQEFLTLFPAQSCRTQNRAQGVATHQPSQAVGYPTPQLLQRPPPTGQTLLMRRTRFDDRYNFRFCRLGKKGERPPLWR